MIPREVSDLADLIEPGWAGFDDERRHEILKIAGRIHDAGYRKTEEKEDAA
jgi:hypothetical protein